jgi:hypothetical protein
MSKGILAAVTLAGAASAIAGNVYYGAGPGAVAAHITANTTWTSGNVYYLQDPVFVKDGAVLTIQPGTVIRGTQSTGSGDFPGALVVSRGSKIHAVGTPTQPIIMTGENDNNVPGMTATAPWNDDENGYTQLWGGLIVLGRAFIATNTGGSGTPSPNAALDLQIEGLEPFGEYSRYGGGNDDDSSGEIKYLQIRYGGFVLGEANEINGLTLGAVGRGTKISFVEITNNKDDGVEFFGSTVNTKYMIVRNSADDSFDWDEGYRGKGQFWLVVQGSLHTTTDSSDKGSECDGGKGDTSQPSSCPTIYNATYVGLGQNLASNGKNTALNFRDGTGARFYNSMFLDFGGAIAIVEGAASGGTAAEKTTLDYPQNLYYDHEANGSKMLEIRNCYFANFGTPTIPGWPQNTTNFGGAYGTDDTDGNKPALAYPVLADGALGNQYEAVSLDPTSYSAPLYFERSSTALAGKGKSVYNVTYLDGYIPAADMPSVTARAVPTGDGFFSDVDFVGAFGSDPRSNWLMGWTFMDRLGMVPHEYDGATPYAYGDFESLTTEPALSITDFYQSMTLRFYASAGKTYSIEASTDVSFVNSNVVSTVGTVVGEGAYVLFNDLQRISGNRFYRVVEAAE